jgi:hypothetical protein
MARWLNFAILDVERLEPTSATNGMLGSMMNAATVRMQNLGTRIACGTTTMGS